MINEHDIKDWHHIRAKILEAEPQDDGTGILTVEFLVPPEFFNLTPIEMMAAFVVQETKHD